MRILPRSLTLAFLVFSFAFAVASVNAVEPGRKTYSGSEAGKRTEPTFVGVKGIDLTFGPGWGSWSTSRPDDGNPGKTLLVSHEERGWPLTIGVFYAINSFADIRLGASFESYEDQDKQGSCGLTGIGPGSRLRISLGTDWQPYLEAVLMYYWIDAEEEEDIESIKSTFGISLQFGVSYLMTDNFSVSASLGHNRLFSDATVYIAGKKGELEFNSTRISLGVSLYY